MVNPEAVAWPDPSLAGQDYAPHDATPVEIAFTDLLIDQFIERITTKQPERGGILLGFGTTATVLLDDDHGQYSAAHWDVSDAVVALATQAQRAGCGFYVGQIHSHPAGVLDPSGPDRRLMEKALINNVRADVLMVPIISEGTAREGDIQLTDEHVLSTMVISRLDGGPRWVRASSRIIPIGEHYRELCSTQPTVAITTHQSPSELSGRVMRVGDRTHMALPLPKRQLLLIDSDYPNSAPTIVSLSNDPGQPPQAESIGEWDPSRSVEKLRNATMRATETPPDPDDSDRLARVRPLVGSLGGNVLIAGAGSVGSRIAEELARAGVKEFTIVDPDTVSAPNLARSCYVASDVGTAKPHALAAHLQAIDPTITVRMHHSTLGSALPRLFPHQGPTSAKPFALVIGATDDMEEQFQLSEYAYHAQVPLVACALYQRAAAGEVIMSVPAAETACLRCTIQDWDPDIRPQKNYGVGGRLDAEPGLGAAINVVASYAALVALGLLAGPRSETGRSVMELVATKRTYGKLTTVPRWDFFPQVMGLAEHQHAPQSVWITVQRQPQCGVCGENPVPPVRSDDAAQLAGFLDQFRTTEEQLPTEPATTPQPRPGVDVSRTRGGPKITIGTDSPDHEIESQGSTFSKRRRIALIVLFILVAVVCIGIVIGLSGAATAVAAS